MLNQLRENQLLAILFAAKEPVSLSELRAVFPDVRSEELRQSVELLARDFNACQGAVEVREIGGGFRVTTRPEHHEIVREYLKTRPSARLSHAALETLAVIAYRQPVTLPEIMDIRGVKGTTTITTLLEKKLIEIRGRKKVVGRPILYGTTTDFLVHFGLSDLSDLPSLEEFEDLLKTGQELMEENLGPDPGGRVEEGGDMTRPISPK